MNTIRWGWISPKSPESCESRESRESPQHPNKNGRKNVSKNYLFIGSEFWPGESTRNLESCERPEIDFTLFVSLLFKMMVALTVISLNR